MITKIEIDGFKSFKDFDMEFTPLTVIAGINASGKSNLFDAIQLLSRMAEVDLRTAFGEQRGDAGELFQKYENGQSANEMSFAVEMIVDKKIKDNWGQKAELDNTKLRYEISIIRSVNTKGFEKFQITEESLFLHDSDQDKQQDVLRLESMFLKNIKSASYEQSILSGNIQIDPNPYAFAAREEMRSWKIMQLYPEDISQPVKQSVTDYQLTRTGKNLAGLLYRLSKEDEYALIEIARTLNRFLPDFVEVLVEYNEITRLFHFSLKNTHGQIFPSQALSEGTLRLLALSVMLHDPEQKGVLCFEEPENGVHPYQIRSMLQLLRDLSTPIDEINNVQVIVNTHSPIVVDEARKWTDNEQVSLWFMRMDTRITTIEGNRLAIKITKATPVFDEVRASVDFTEQEQKVTIAEVKKYLNSIQS